MSGKKLSWGLPLFLCFCLVACQMENPSDTQSTSSEKESLSLVLNDYLKETGGETVVFLQRATKSNSLATLCNLPKAVNACPFTPPTRVACVLSIIQ